MVFIAEKISVRVNEKHKKKNNSSSTTTNDNNNNSKDSNINTNHQQKGKKHIAAAIRTMLSPTEYETAKGPQTRGRAGERADDWAQNIENTFACNRILWRVVFTALRKLQKHRATRMCECVWAYLTVALLASCVSLRSRPSLAALPFVVIILLIDTDCSSVHSNISAKDFKDNTLHKN